jgi:hypothetical protein
MKKQVAYFLSGMFETRSVSDFGIFVLSLHSESGNLKCSNPFG